MPEKHKTIYPGVRFREHATRRHNSNPDRYFFIRYRLNGKLKEEGLGWGSEGWSAKKASLVLSKLKEAHVSGDGPQTLAERRRLQQERRQTEQIEEEKRKREEMTFSQLFLDKYSPQAKGNKGAQSFRREQDLFSLWISPVIGNVPLKEIAPFHLERLKKNIADAGGAPRSIRYALAVVRQVFNFARKNDLHDGESPTSKVKMPQGDNRRLRFLTHGEADLLLESLAKKSPQLYEPLSAFIVG